MTASRDGNDVKVQEITCVLDVGDGLGTEWQGKGSLRWYVILGLPDILRILMCVVLLSLR